MRSKKFNILQQNSVVFLKRHFKNCKTAYTIDDYYLKGLLIHEWSTPENSFQNLR